ncbi:hypothetical protein BpHYR1_008385 [Brachionus plicatilis]|uniref:Uncharacterized protein n=1 Tax=Brachionus plicatilis TaxID=10195 RepID=A0A3M7RD16_BRAPC|nr:hypothetical protein BpHYR1_008385 [Brachionus plicatilis]
MFSLQTNSNLTETPITIETQSIESEPSIQIALLTANDNSSQTVQKRGPPRKTDLVQTSNVTQKTSALRALNLLVNANDAESGGSDESDVDFDLEDLDSEEEYLVSDYSSGDECESEFDEPIECSSDQQPPSGQSRNLDKTSKAGVHFFNFSFISNVIMSEFLII